MFKVPNIIPELERDARRLEDNPTRYIAALADSIDDLSAQLPPSDLWPHLALGLSGAQHHDEGFDQV